MSYDLLFSPPANETIEASAMSEYFQTRKNYKVENNQACYINDDTGVYFTFDLGNFAIDDDSQESSPSIASFNLNYFRPHIFALEAVDEVCYFIDKFRFCILDPQMSGMGDGPFTRQGFLQGWNVGNEFAYESIIKQQGISAAQFSLPTQAIEKYWKWNYDRSTLQASFGENLFVPKIFFFQYQERLCSSVVWHDAIPSLLPDTDLYVLLRKDLAPRSFFSKKEDMIVVSKQQIDTLLIHYPTQDGQLLFRKLDYEITPKDIADWVRHLPSIKPALKGVAVDSILNTEIIAKFSSA